MKYYYRFQEKGSIKPQDE